MNALELEKTLPNGFHDAVLEAMRLDFGGAVATLEMKVWVGLLEAIAPGRGRGPVMRRCALQYTGLQFVTIEPPRSDISLEGGLSVSLTSLEEVPSDRLPATPKGAFVSGFYASDWNSYMFLAARDVSLAWQESEEDAWSSARALDGR